MKTRDYLDDLVFRAGVSLTWHSQNGSRIYTVTEPGIGQPLKSLGLRQMVMYLEGYIDGAVRGRRIEHRKRTDRFFSQMAEGMK